VTRPHEGDIPAADAERTSGDGVVLCVGEALIALTPTRGSLRTATDLEVSPAGVELNVAVHLARMGLRSRFAGRVGDDPLGQRLRDALRLEGVDDGLWRSTPTCRPVLTGLVSTDQRGCS
jgi:2-dehydro-3-deoxygluconokinase